MKLEYRDCRIHILELSDGTFCHNIRVTGAEKSFVNFPKIVNVGEKIIDPLHDKGIIKDLLDVR